MRLAHETWVSSVSWIAAYIAMILFFLGKIPHDWRAKLIFLLICLNPWIQLAVRGFRSGFWKQLWSDLKERWG